MFGLPWWAIALIIIAIVGIGYLKLKVFKKIMTKPAVKKNEEED
jgi:uncharacterized membrane protein YkvI